MKKRILHLSVLSFCVALLLLTAGCSAKTLSTEKLRDMDFTVVDEDDIPEALKEMMDEREDKPFKLTFADNGELYIAVGYGLQPTTGYSIRVKELYESKNAVYIHTNLIGPAKDERIIEREKAVSIVVKTEYVDKNVVFQ